MLQDATGADTISRPVTSESLNVFVHKVAAGPKMYGKMHGDKQHQLI